MSKRGKSGAQLSTTESARLDRVAQALKCAVEVFGNEAMAREWMATQLPALGDYTPLELLVADSGLQTVLDTLGQISYGAPA